MKDSRIQPERAEGFKILHSCLCEWPVFLLWKKRRGTRQSNRSWQATATPRRLGFCRRLRERICKYIATTIPLLLRQQHIVDICHVIEKRVKLLNPATYRYRKRACTNHREKCSQVNTYDNGSMAGNSNAACVRVLIIKRDCKAIFN